jgi:outer membrane protein assembly factor BamB
MRYKVIAALLMMSVIGSSATGEDWPRFRGADGSGVSSEQNLLQSWPAGGPTLLWKSRGAGRGYGSVAVAGDQIFTLGDRSTGTPEAAEYLVAFNRVNGTPLWWLKVGKPWHEGEPSWQGARSTPTVAGATTCVLSAYGDLVCCDTPTGKVRWRRNVRSDFEGRKADSWGYSESVLIDDTQVVCTPGGPMATIVALDRETGKLRWKCSQKSDRGAGHASIVVANVGGTKVYLQTTGSGAMAVRAHDGKLLWTAAFAATTAVAPNPIVRDDLVFFSAGYGRGGALIRQVAEGDEIRAKAVYGWKRELANKHGGVILMDECLFGDCEDRGIPFCADFKSGKILWRSRGSGKGSVAIAGADGCLYLRYSDGTMALAKADATGYRECGSFQIPGSGEWPSWSHPSIADGKLYLREQDSLLCYDLREPDSLVDIGGN